MADAKKEQKTIPSTTVNILLVIIIVIAVNIISANLFFRFDITEEQLYTLSEGTAQIVERIDKPTTIKYYFTEDLSTLPLVYKNYGNKIEELLREYVALNRDYLRLEVYNPLPDSDEAVWAEKYGLTGVNLASGERLFMGIVATQEDKEVSIPLMDPRRERYLEYDITQLLLQLSQKQDKVVGVMSSLPVMGRTASRMQRMQGQQDQPKWVFMQELEKTFHIKTVPTNQAEIDPEISILLVIHPKNLSQQALYAIDQFVLRGGELIVLVDPNARVDPTAAMMAQMGQMPQASSDLEKLFTHWGIEYPSQQVLADKDHATRVNAGGSIGAISYSLWHTLTRESFNDDLIVTKELEEMLMIEPGGFTMSEDSPLDLEPLIKSSANSGMVDAFMIRYADPLNLNKQVETDEKIYYLAGILTGELTSAFAGRPKIEKSDTEEAEDKVETPVYQNPHRPKSQGRCKILLVTDADFISDHFSVEQFNLLGQVFSQPRNDNLNFMVNMVEFLGGAEEMMKIRSRGRFSRPFIRFRMLEKQAQEKYQEAESRLTAKLEEVQEKLSQLNVQKGTNEIVLTKEQIEKIKQFREEEKKTKTELRKIRKLLRQDIEREKTILTLLNLVVVPVLLVIVGLILYYRRFHRRRAS